MDPKYQTTDRNEQTHNIYQTDVMNTSEILEENSVDLVVTSPPYNIGKEYEKNLERSDYLEFTRRWIEEVKKVLKDNGTFWLNIGFHKESKGKQYIPWEYDFYPLIKEIGGFKLVQQVIWNYNAGVNCKLRFSPRKETWMFYVRDLDDYTFNLDDVRVPHKYPNQKKNGKIRVNPHGKNPGDVWNIQKVTSGKGRAEDERTKHPAQFPEEVIQRIIKVSSNEGDTVLDPLAGSGTTMKVARDLGRSSIGVEKNEEYVDDIIKSRVFDDYSKQATLDE